MKNGILYSLLIAIAAVVGYAVAGRCMEETRDFR
ncbi:hypothetical protein J2Z81_000914 [Virgibacillus campisalis]|uniref:Uncharacterized protein n=1 Tax=Virgibacillus alimentarius TaxID=698769 RepID=A0ABS4S7I8_9BACI|nr:hypothetical protein [Virgibacillus alimentarius]